MHMRDGEIVMHMRDGEIVEFIVAGDPDGLAAVYDRYADPLYKYCRSMIGDPADAAHAVRDTFVIAASRLDGLREPERLRAWLYAVARNECLGMLRDRRSRSALDEAPGMTAGTADVGEDAERAELRALLRDAAGGLNPAEREVIELQLRQGLEPAEVAAVLGVSRNHVHSLLSRARDQLETCLGVLLVGRTGGGECGEPAGMLTGWDGRLTVLLRKRVHRHIEHCPTCFTRRAFELRPAMLLGLSPGAAMAAAAADSFRLAASAPAGLRGHTLTVVFGQGPTAIAHRAAVLGRAGPFGKQGFPKPAQRIGAKAGLLQHGPKGGLPSSPQGKAAVGGGVLLAAAIAAVAVALTGNSLAGGKPPGSAPAQAAAGVTRAAVPGSRTATSPAGTSAAKPTTAAPTSSTLVPPPVSAPANPAPAPTSAGPAPAPAPPPAPGRLVVSPSGGPLVISPGGVGASITLTAQGGAVNWSITVSGDRHVHVGASSGTLAAGTSVAVTIRADTTATGGTVTVNPGGTVFTIVVSGALG
jgi:RNA polymerase sigma factor (sigma-70 family)